MSKDAKARQDGSTAKRWIADKPLLFVVSLLLCFGFIMIYSASALEADEKYGNALHFTMRQGIGAIAGCVGIVVLQIMPIDLLKRWSIWMYLLGIIALILVFTPLGYTAYGASRWIRLGGINIQSSEFAKIALILLLASYLSNNEGRLSDIVGVVVPALVIPLPVIGLLLAEPDFGTTVITVGITGVMLFVAGLQWRFTFLIGAALGAVFSFIAVLEPYRIRRFTSFLDPFKDPEGSGYQVIQGWIAMGSGGWWGQGIATGVAKRGGLPEAHNDFISAVVAEELGVWGWSILIFLYIVLIWRAYQISSHANDLYGSLIGTAVTTMLGVQIVINLGVVVGWMPSKGLVLPFMSYGASAVVAYLICVGLLLRISSETKVLLNESGTRDGGSVP